METAKNLDLFMISDDELAQHLDPRARVAAPPEPEPEPEPVAAGEHEDTPLAVVLPFQGPDDGQVQVNDAGEESTSPPCPDCGSRWGVRQAGPPAHFWCPIEGTRFIPPAR
jgi:hypothetical protein